MGHLYTVKKQGGRFLRKIFVTAIILCSAFASVAQPWAYDFGTGTGTHPTNTISTTFLTGTPAGGGTYRVRTGGAGGTIILVNPGTTLGTNTELQIQSSTSTATNKFGVYDWNTPTQIGYLKTKIRTTSTGTGNLNLSFGINTAANDNQGYTSHYNNSLASLRIVYTAGAISAISRRTSGTDNNITGSGITKDGNNEIEFYLNNAATGTNYTRSGVNTLNAQSWDLWVDGVKISPAGGWARAGTLASGVNLSGFGFFAESSAGNAAFLYLDDLEYSNAFPVTTINYYWNGSTTTGTGPVTGGSGTWNTATNWISPTNNAAGTPTAWVNSATNSIANFPAGPGTVDLGTDITATGINVAANYIYSSTVARTITSPIDITAAGSLSLSGIGPGSITIPGIISGSGGVGFNSTGSGFVTLNGNNTHTGTKNIIGGLLNLGHANALGASGTLNISGGTLDNTSGAAITTPNYPQTWNGNFAFTGTNALNLGTGAVNLAAGTQVTVTASTLTVGGVISGSPILTKAGAGNLLLTGTNTYNGGTMISGGTLTLGSATTLANATPMILNGGTLKTGTTTGFSETMGTLELLENSTIALGTGNHSIVFSNSTGVSWTPAKTLTITGWTGTVGTAGNPNGKIIVGAGGLTATQLAQVTFSGFNPGAIIVSGELVPAPLAIDFVNLQFPGTATITVSNSVNIYAQAYEPGVTEAAGQGAGITAWIGVNTADTDPATWGSIVWIPATFNTQAGNNDEYTAAIGATLAPGTYYYASRFLITGGLYQYGGFNGGAWNGTSNINGVLTVNDNTVDFCNIQNPASGSILRGGGFNVYSQVYEPGMTEAAGANSNIAAWIGYSTSNTNPNTAGWTWVPLTYNLQAGNNDEYWLNLGTTLAAVGPGTYYYATRYQIGAGSYQYGGTGGIWSNNSGVLNIADVKGNGNTIAYQGTTTSTTNNTDFGSMCIGTPVVKTFTISNASTTNTLSFGAVTITGAQAADFTVTTAPVTPVAASGSTSFQVSFSAGAAGARNAVINVATDAATYYFSVTGTGQVTPVINTHPSSTIVTSPTAATFTVASANGTGFQWQWYNGATWVDLVNGVPYSGVTTATLTVSPTNVSYNDYEFRCVVKANAPCADAISNSALLTVNQGPCGSESFTNSTATGGGYTSGSYTGDNGITWTYANGREAQGAGYPITGKGMMFGATNGLVTSATVPGGIGTFTCSLRKGFTASGNRQVELFVNGISRGTSILFGNASGADNTIHTFTVPNINITGNVIIEIRNITGNQAVVDDISWTCYNQCTPTATITDFTPSTGPVNTLVTITGSGFTGVTDVLFGAASGTSVTVVNDNTITVKVPSGAPASDKITLVKSPCNTVSTNPFVLIAQSGSCGVTGSGTVTDLFISEVYDAEVGSLSYVEVFNGTASPITLTGVYKIRIRTGSSTDNDYDLTGSIASGAVRVMLIGSGSTACSGVTANDSYPGGSGFNGNDRVYLLKNGTAIDYVPNPNYPSSSEAPGFSQSRNATTTRPRPSMTFFSDDWTLSTTENCNNLSVAPYTLTGTTVTINPHPVDVNCNQIISFTVSATTTGTGTLSYVWRYNAPGTNTWGLVSALPNVTVTGSGTNTITITGSTAELANYQFYVDASFGSPGCTVSSNAAQYTYDSRIVYRSKQSGNWSDKNTWEMSNDMSTWVNACTYPVAVNSNEIIVQNTHSVVQDIDADISVDKVTINSGGTLSTNPSAAINLSNSAAGADLIVNGTYIDNNNNSNTIGFATNATWTLGASGTIIKTNSSGAAGYRDNYEGGIATIPATANWIYRYTSSMPASIGFASANATHPMYYPNLTLENTVAANTFSSNFNAATPALSTFTMLGTVNPITVKGNFDVGGSGPGFINFLNINTISPVFVEGNMIVRTGNTLRNNGDATNNGAGFDVKGNLTVDGTFINNGGTANIGLLRFSGILPQTISGAGTMDLENVDIANTAAGIVHVNRNLSIPGVLSLGSALAKLDVNTGIITLKSSAARTAQVGSIPLGALVTYGTTGRFEVERYLPPLKAWRFLSTPIASLNSPTITEAWREGGGLTSTGYGTQITGPEGAANGFDAVTTGYSMKWYNATNSNYTSVTNTSGTIANDAGYMVFVRGDRSIGVGGTTGATNLRIKGQIRTGIQLFPTLANSFQSIGNPYPSRISFPDLLTGNPLIGSYYVAWDPSLNGSYAVGGFQTLSSLDGYQAQAPAPGAGTSSLYIVNNTYPDIESGQAFYVQNPTASPLPIMIDEDMKTTGSRIASRENTMEDRQFMRTRLYTNTGDIADGNMVAFDDELSNDFDADDAIKFTNSGENFGMSRFGKKLSVEARNRVQASDTIHYNMSNLREQEYKISLLPEKLSGLGMEAYFVDRFLNTQTPVSLAGNTDITISITSNAASKAANRFYLVFKALAGPLPVTFVSVAAQRQPDRTIAVKWKVANEINIDHYEVERSANGIQFNSILTNDAQSVADYSKNDLSPLAADNFYRIKAVGIDGSLTYSAIVKVSPLKVVASISVYPNPVVNGQLGLQFTGQAKGAYRVQLINAKGQLVYNGTVNVTGDNFNETIQLGETLAPGTYQLSVHGADGKITNNKVLIQ